MKFEFATATEIVFGSGRARELGKRARQHGQRALVVTGAHARRFEALITSLAAAGVTWESFAIEKEPTTELARLGVECALKSRAELVIGIGGGSVLDAAKAIAALATNGGDPLDFLEVVGRGKPLEKSSLPTLLLPTTSGTGSEVTRNAVLQVEAERVKVSLRSPWMLPTLALVDPELTLSVPPDVTRATGLDALTQVLEPFVCNARGPLTDALCMEGMRRAARSLRRAVSDGAHLEAREDMAVVSLFGGLALANAKLGAVHGFAGPLGGAYDAPHGALCARLLPGVIAANLQQARASDATEVVARYATVAELLTGRAGATPEAGLAWVQELVDELGVPRLREYGVQPEHFPDLIRRARAASSMKGNPVELSEGALQAILEGAL